MVNEDFSEFRRSEHPEYHEVAAVPDAANVDCTALWGVGQEKISYLFLQVKKDSFVPAK